MLIRILNIFRHRHRPVQINWPLGPYDYECERCECGLFRFEGLEKWITYKEAIELRKQIANQAENPVESQVGNTVESQVGNTVENPKKYN